MATQNQHPYKNCLCTNLLVHTVMTSQLQIPILSILIDGSRGSNLESMSHLQTVVGIAKNVLQYSETSGGMLISSLKMDNYNYS